MIHSLFNLHMYWIINLAIALSYLFARGFLQIALVQQRLSQRQQLAFARFCFLLSMSAFLSMPSLTAFLPMQSVSFELNPILSHASAAFLKHHAEVAIQISTVHHFSSALSFNLLLNCLWIGGFCFVSAKLMSVILKLQRFKNQAFCRHQIQGIHILFSQTTSTPFCWSFINKHFIVIPTALLEKTQDMRLALGHELQHIRQGDTQWLQLLSLLKLLFFWNPFFSLWQSWLSELQEFSCDEALILHGHASPSNYAQCLINTAREALLSTPLATQALGIHGISTLKLHRRVNMLFSYKNKKKKLTRITAYTLSFCVITSAAYAINGHGVAALSEKAVSTLIAKSNLTLPVAANQDVVSEINRIRADHKATDLMRAALNRMHYYGPVIKAALAKNNIPADFLVLPLVESGYKPLQENVNPVHAAGIWQIIPSTAQNLGLVIGNGRDDRMDTQLSTQAAIVYLKSLYGRFHDWRLAALSYEIGENQVKRLMDLTGSQDAWTLVRSKYMPDAARAEVKNYMAMFDASIIIMHNPTLLAN